MTPIDPARLYSFTEAAPLVPSPYGGGVSLHTLHNWRVAGLLPFAVERRIGRRSFWFLRGEDVGRLANGEALGRVGAPPTAVPVGARSQAAEKELSRKLGLNF